MSANLIVDIGSTCHFAPSVVSQFGPASGTTIGVPVDLGDANIFCNLFVTAGGGSGAFLIQVQTADSTSGAIYSGGGLPLSGAFTDPTSGLAQLPTWFSSGGILVVNSGLYAIPGGANVAAATLSGQFAGGYPAGSLPFGLTSVINGMGGPAFIQSGTWPEFASGGIAFAAFQRVGRFARANILAGSGAVPQVAAGFVTQLRTTGSGGGFSWLPQSGLAVANV